MKNPVKSSVQDVVEKPSSEIAAERRLETARDRDVIDVRLSQLKGDQETAHWRPDRERFDELEIEIKALERDLSFADQAVANFELEEREALDREAEDYKRQAFDEAQAASEQGEKYLRKYLRESGLGYRKMLRQWAETDIQITRVNANLPAGVDPLKTLEERLLRAHVPRRDLETVELALWVGKYDGQIVPENRQAAVVADDDMSGVLPSSDRRGSGKPVIKRRFRRTKYLPAVSGYSYDGFASVLNIPGLAHEPPLFTPSASDAPEHVLEHLDQLEEYDRQYSSPRKPQFEFVPIENENTAAAE